MICSLRSREDSGCTSWERGCVGTIMVNRPSALGVLPVPINVYTMCVTSGAPRVSKRRLSDRSSPGSIRFHEANCSIGRASCRRATASAILPHRDGFDHDWGRLRVPDTHLLLNQTGGLTRWKAREVLALDQGDPAAAPVRCRIRQADVRVDSLFERASSCTITNASFHEVVARWRVLHTTCVRVIDGSAACARAIAKLPGDTQDGEPSTHRKDSE